jgi:hypothetical protein
MAIVIAITGFDLTRLAAAAALSVATCRRVYQGRPCEMTTRVRLERAATELRLPLPPPAGFSSQPELGVAMPLQFEAKQ